MAKIYTAEKTEEVLVDLINQKLNNKKYLQALCFSSTLINFEDFDRLNAYSLRARIYYKMKQYARSAEEWFKYLTYAKSNSNYAKAYNGLGACFYKMEDLSAAGYYFNRQITADKTAIFEYSSITAEFYSEIISNDKNYYLAYPYEKADFTRALEKADAYLKINDYHMALDILKDVPKTSKFYADALLTKSISKYFISDLVGAISDIEESLKLDLNVISLCNAISMFYAIKNEEKLNKYLAILKTLDLKTEEEIYKGTMVYAEQGDNLTALKYAKKYLKLNPYDTSMLLVYGMINYNLKDYKEAEKSFLDAYKISNGETPLYYYNLAIKKNIDVIEYSFDIPSSERLKKVKKIGELLNGDLNYKLSLEEEIYKISKYAFSVAYYQMQSSAITLLGEINTPKAVNILKSALLSIQVFDRVKSGIIGFLVAGGFEGELSVVYGNVFKKICLYSADFSGDNLFLEAYAYAVAKLSPVESDFLPIKKSAEDVYVRLIASGNIDKVKDVKSLSAVIYELSSISKIKSRRDFSKFFNANLKEIKKIKELLN